MSEPVTSRIGIVTPYLVVSDGHAQIEFLKKAFAAEVIFGPEETPDGRFGHCEVKVLNSVVMIGEAPNGKPVPGMVYLEVEDCDAVYAKLLAAGATALRPPADMENGCRHGGTKDVNGNQWWVGSSKPG